MLQMPGAISPSPSSSSICGFKGGRQRRTVPRISAALIRYRDRLQQRIESAPGIPALTQEPALC
jgi:hypothetical protein